MRKILKSLLIPFIVCFIGLPTGLVSLPYDTHLVTEIYQEANLIALEDGSQWQTSNYDFYELTSWSYQPMPPIVITPNYLSSRFNYYLTNQDTGSYVRANLVRAPLRGSPFAVTLLGVDNYAYESGVLYLSNGTFWKVSSLDLGQLIKWYRDDLIIIGKNNEWLSFNTHILINIHTNQFVRAQRL